MIDAIAAWMRLKPGPLRNALWLAATLMTITSSYTLVKTSRDVLFLSKLPAQSLPYVFLGIGAFTLAVSFVFGRLTHRLTALQSLVWTSIGSALALFAFTFFLDIPGFWVPVAFYLWVNAYGLILVSQFWTYTNAVSDPHEAKRIFGLIGGGGILGGLVGGMLVAWMGPRVPIQWLTIMGATMLLVTGPALALGVRRGTVREPEAKAVEEAPPPLGRGSYVRWLALAVLCSVLVTGLLDYQLKVVIQEAYPASKLAWFFGRFYLAVGVAALLLQLVGSRFVLQRLGAAWASVMLPAGLLAGGASALVAPGFANVLGVRLWDQVLRFSLNKSATELFYFPLEPGLKRRAKAFIEAGIERFGDALAGLTILGLGLVLGRTPQVLAATVCVVVLVWLAAWWNLRSGYIRELGRSLRRLKLEPEHATNSLQEISVLKELVRLLESPYERVVLHALDMLASADATRLVFPRLPRLLEHPSPLVRARALAMAAERPDDSYRSHATRLASDPDPSVRLQALRAHVALGDGSLASLDPFLHSPDPDMRATALAGMAELATEADLPVVRGLIEGCLESDDPKERRNAAEALGARPWPGSFDDLWRPLLEDRELEVRRAALRSAGRAAAQDRVPTLLLALGDPDLQQAARESLVGFGEPVTGALGDWLRDVRAPIEVRRVIPRVLGEMPSRAAIDALYRCRDRTDVLLFYRILKASNRIRVTDRKLEFPAALVSEDLIYDVKSFLGAELHVRSQGEGEHASERFLRMVLLERMDQAYNRVFRRLALLYPAGPMFSAYLGLLTAQARLRGTATEYVESALSPEHRAVVMPLMPDASPESRSELANQFGLHDLSPLQSLEALLADNDSWLRTCALYVAGCRRERSLRAHIELNRGAADERVRETADWAMLALETG